MSTIGYDETLRRLPAMAVLLEQVTALTTWFPAALETVGDPFPDNAIDSTTADLAGQDQEMLELVVAGLAALRGAVTGRQDALDLAANLMARAETVAGNYAAVSFTHSRG